MAEPSCPGCRALAQRVAELEALVRELLARLGTNASNSSLPPSANPPQAPPPVVKKKSKRSPGGQVGHPPHLKQLLPPERVTTVVPFVPACCGRCHAPLSARAQAHDPSPTRFQTIELPPVVAVVTEYQGHARTCPACGEVTHAAIPQELRAHGVGPHLTATLSYFSGCHGLGKRA